MALTPVADALANMLAQAAPLSADHVPLAAAHGRVLTESLVARRTQPPTDVSAMDGYAVRAADIATPPCELRVVGEVAAGHPFPGCVKNGEAARIFTGGLIPPGADTVVIQEDVERDGERIVVTIAGKLGRHIRRAGLDFTAGEVLLEKGRRLSGRDLSLAAAMNYPVIPVHRRPKVAVLATGDELVPPGTETGPGQIIYSNGYSLMTLVASEGADVLDAGLVPDRIEDTKAAVRRARDLGVDVLVTSGGASVGDHDLMREALGAEGLALTFWRLALRPGKPLMHGRIGPMHVLGAPGNPVSAFICSFLFLVPLLRKLAGRGDLHPPVESARLGHDLRANDERSDYMRATLTPCSDGVPMATPVQLQDSSMMAALARADCLIIREPFDPATKAGDLCRIVKLPL